MRFKIFRRFGIIRRHNWYFRATAENGKVILQSEGYRNHADCLKTVRLIQTEANRAVIDDSEWAKAAR